MHAYLLRGTMHTVMSNVDDAIADLENVINAGDDEKYSKVGFMQNFKRSPHTSVYQH